jgi:hypothetical protein
MTDENDSLDPGSDLAATAAFGQESQQSGHSVEGSLSALREHLDHLEQMLGPEVRGVGVISARLEPAWRRATEGEARAPVLAAMLVALALQLVLPARFEVKPTWLLPALQGALLAGLVAANPRRIERSTPLLRVASMALIALISAANAWSAASLVDGIVTGAKETGNAPVLLGSGAAIYVTNIIVFALWYWELDRGGPVARKQGSGRQPDFMFVQMDKPHLAPTNWRPFFFDYLWLSFTNATAFSPTDTMPLSRMAKAVMMIQAAISLITVGLVIARAVNIFR